MRLEVRVDYVGEHALTVPDDNELACARSLGRLTRRVGVVEKDLEAVREEALRRERVLDPDLALEHIESRTDALEGDALTSKCGQNHALRQADEGHSFPTRAPRQRCHDRLPDHGTATNGGPHISLDPRLERRAGYVDDARSFRDRVQRRGEANVVHDHHLTLGHILTRTTDIPEPSWRISPPNLRRRTPRAAKHRQRAGDRVGTQLATHADEQNDLAGREAPGEMLDRMEPPVGVEPMTYALRG